MSFGTPFPKGTSGNPGGRPKASGLAKLIRSETREGAELVEDALKVLRDPQAARKDKNVARAWLSERGWGKAVQEVDLNVGGSLGLGGAPIDMTKLTPAQLDALAELDREDEDAGDDDGSPG